MFLFKFLIERAAYENCMLDYKYKKPNIPFMKPSVISVYQAHASQPNRDNIMKVTLGQKHKKSEIPIMTA